MRRTLIVVIGGLAGAAAGYFAAYVPEHRRATEAQSQLAAAPADLAAAQSSIRTARLLGALLLLEETVLNQDYGEAQNRATIFFDDVRVELSRTTDPALRRSLEGMLNRRDQVIAGLARAEPAVLAILREIEFQVRDALGYEVPERRPRTPNLTP